MPIILEASLFFSEIFQLIVDYREIKQKDKKNKNERWDYISLNSKYLSISKQVTTNQGIKRKLSLYPVGRNIK